MYLDYYKLEAKPFQITTDPKFLWLGEKYKEALAALRYGVMDNSGFILLTGEVGTGKTILINRLVTMLDIGTAVATIPDPDLASMDFYHLVADGFQMNRTFESKGAFLIRLRDFLHQGNAAKKNMLLIIDECQRLNHSLMEDIRLLSNIELDDRKPINIFFVGQPDFNTILNSPQNRAIVQRISIRYHIEPLNLEETEQYIYHRLKSAGNKRLIFNREALSAIFAFSDGIPGVINMICEQALMTGFSRGSKEIDTDIVQECARDLGIATRQPDDDDAIQVGLPATPRIINARQEGPNSPQRLQSPAQLQAAAPRKESIADPVRPRSSIAWKTIFIILVALLAGLVAFTITRLNRNQGPRWDLEELTPDKYLTTLEKEKEALTQRLKAGLGEAQEADGRSVAAGLREESAPSASDHVGPSQPASAAPVKEGQIAPLPLMKERIVIHFSLNSNDIEPDSFPVLDRVATYLRNNPEGVIYLRGYTDSSGTSSYNKNMSAFRANVVKSYLLGKGALSENVKVFAMGDSSPIASNATKTGRIQNRRVEIEFPSNDAASQ